MSVHYKLFRLWHPAVAAHTRLGHSTALKPKRVHRLHERGLKASPDRRDAEHSVIIRCSEAQIVLPTH